MSDSAPAVFEITVDVTYRPMVTPPRCRNPRPVPQTRTINIAVPAVTGQDAPVVARQGPRAVETYRDGRELRHYAGSFYARTTDLGHNPVLAGTSLAAHQEHDSYSADFAEAVRDARSPYEDSLVIDGEVWEEVGEPVYAIFSLGLGGDGSTGIEIQYLDVARHRTAADGIFSALEPAAALDAAGKVAAHNRDTTSVGYLKTTFRPVEVIDPSVFKVPTTAQRETQARKQVRGLLDEAAALLTGPVTRTKLGAANDLLEQASNAMLAHGLDEVA